MCVCYFCCVNDFVMEGSVPQIFLPKMPSLKTRISHLTIDGLEADLASFFLGQKSPDGAKSLSVLGSVHPGKVA